MRTKLNIYVVVPAYNEQKYIGKVLEKIQKFTTDIIMVDDGSDDDTYKIASSLTRYVLRHDLNLGKGAAMKTGCEYAFKNLAANAVIFMDSDDQHNPEELPQFLDKLEDGCDLVFGVRPMRGRMPLMRVLGNKFTSLMVNLLFGRYIPDIPSGYKALTMEAYKKIKWNASDYGVELEIAARAAKLHMPYSTIKISTIYHDLNRGMTVIDGIKTIIKLLEWRVSL